MDRRALGVGQIGGWEAPVHIMVITKSELQLVQMALRLTYNGRVASLSDGHAEPTPNRHKHRHHHDHQQRPKAVTQAAVFAERDGLEFQGAHVSRFSVANEVAADVLSKRRAAHSIGGAPPLS